MNSKFTFLMSVVLSLFFLQTSLANNNYFLPGDAFFPCKLTKTDFEKMQETKNGERSFTYSRLEGYRGAFCGYAGYGTAVMPVVDDAFAENLVKAYKRIREYESRQLIEVENEDGEISYVETNGVQVLFYNSDFDFSKHSLGVRYNENWLKEVVAFGHNREHARLCPLVHNRDAISRSWRDGDLVPALKAKLPAADGESLKETLNESIVVEADVKAIVIQASTSLDDIFNKEPGASLFVVDAKGIKEMYLKGSKWEEGKFGGGGFGGGGSGGGVFKD